MSSGMAIYDTMQFVPCDVRTVCFGTAASMGAFLLGAGARGKRAALPNARIMIHQPLGGVAGQAEDVEIAAKEILYTKALLNGLVAEYTGQPVAKVAEDTDRDFFMTPRESSCPPREASSKKGACLAAAAHPRLCTAAACQWSTLPLCSCAPRPAPGPWLSLRQARRRRTVSSTRW